MNSMPARAGVQDVADLCRSAGRAGQDTADTDTFEGRFVELVRDEKIAETIVFEADDPKFAGEMILTAGLTDVDGGTEVTMLHENLPTGVRPEDNELGTTISLRKLAAPIGSQP
jgi:uncharacterized protein YndB with AHSA1/START domain